MKTEKHTGVHAVNAIGMIRSMLETSLAMTMMVFLLNAHGCSASAAKNNPDQTGMKVLTIENTEMKMKVEIWSDIMCPFCYIGKRHFEQAMARFSHRSEIELEWHSFQLDPQIPRTGIENKNVYQYLAERKGWSYEQSVKVHENVVEMAKRAGLDYRFDKAVVANSFDAHRMIQMAKTKGLGDAAEERLFSAYFSEGKNFGQTQTLVELGSDIGLSEADVRESLSNALYAEKVNQDIREAGEIGINGVPFFIFDRKYAVSGAQPADVFLQTLERSYSEWKNHQQSHHPETPAGEVCKPGSDCK